MKAYSSGSAVKMSRSTPKLQVNDLNPHLSCILCGGYFIDATTIIECVHSFCRACIVRYLETSKYCPVCEVLVQKNRPLHHYIRSDKILQDIVYKIVPGLFHNEMKRRRELYASQPPEAIKESRDAEDRGECLDEKFIYAPEEIFSLSVEYGTELESQDSSSEGEQNAPKKRFLRCPAAVTVGHLKKFLRSKYGIPYSYDIDLIYDKEESLVDDYTLIDVAYIFLWKRKRPMRLVYKITERPPKVKIQPLPIEIEEESEKEDSEQLEDDDKSTKQESEGNEVVLPPTDVQTVTQQEDLIEKKESQDVTPSTNHLAMEIEDEKDQKIDVSPKKTESDKDIEKEHEKPIMSVVSPKKELKTTILKFLPTSSSKSSTSDSKPAVMTVAPLTKPSSSLPTTSATASTGTITHGLYTGITIKKSPPNTLPTYQVSSHLLPPRVPPLKLSPPRFSRLENCIRQLPKESSKKSSSQSKKSKSLKGSSDKLESKVAQLKSATVKHVAPLVITVPPEIKTELRKEILNSTVLEKKQLEPPTTPIKTSCEESKCNVKDYKEEEKIDLDSDIFEGPLVIAEPETPSKEDSDSRDDKLSNHSSKDDPKPVDTDDEEIDVVDDGEADSGRGSDISRTEARSLCGDDDLGSPDSVPKTPEAESPPISMQNHTSLEDSESKAKVPKCNGASPIPVSNCASTSTASNDNGVLDLSTCSRKRNHDGELSVVQRSKPVANPAVLDKIRQTTPCRSPEHPSFKVFSSVLPHANMYKNKSDNHGRNNFKCRGNTLTVINPDPNGNRPKIVIRNLGPKPERAHDRFHSHHHSHHQHHHNHRM